MKPSLMSAADLAREIGCNRSTVSRVAKRLQLGQPVGPILLLSSAEAASIRAVVRKTRGNPNFVPGNHFGRPAKKVSKKNKKR